ncbi:MAG: oligoribonuclease, partial [Undibacterium sp.]|nr:oligoribonuclease [Undibacterium sp.]
MDVNKSPIKAASKPNEMNLIWVDMEMTGLDPDADKIIEVAVVVTDMQLNVLAEGPVFAIHQSDAVLDKMDNWNKGTHGRSGLIDRVKASTVTEEEAETARAIVLSLEQEAITKKRQGKKRVDAATQDPTTQNYSIKNPTEE